MTEVSEVLNFWLTNNLIFHISNMARWWSLVSLVILVSVFSYMPRRSGFTKPFQKLPGTNIMGRGSDLPNCWNSGWWDRKLLSRVALLSTWVTFARVILNWINYLQSVVYAFTVMHLVSLVSLVSLNSLDKKLCFTIICQCEYVKKKKLAKHKCFSSWQLGILAALGHLWPELLHFWWESWPLDKESRLQCTSAWGYCHLPQYWSSQWNRGLHRDAIVSRYAWPSPLTNIHSGNNWAQE